MTEVCSLAIIRANFVLTRGAIVRNKVWYILSVALSIIMVTTGALSCSGNSGGKSIVKLAMADYFNTWLSTYAIRENIITSDKVDVRMDLIADFDLQMRVGNYPMGAMSTSMFAISCEQSGLKFKGLSTMVVHQGAVTQSGVNILYTKADSAINSPADLIGKKVGVPDLTSSATSVFLGMLKQEYGINEDQLVLEPRANPLLLELLRRGELDAAMLGGNISPRAYVDPSLKIVWNLDEVFYNKYGGVFFPSMLVVEEKYYNSNQDLAREVYELLVRSNAYGEQHFAELAAKYIAEYDQNQSLEFYQMIFDNHSRNQLLPIEGRTRDTLMTTFEMVQTRGIITTLPDPSVVFVTW